MTQHLQGYLSSGDALARLHDQAARLRRLQQTLEQALPAPLASACHIANLKKETLVIATDGSAAAVRLKQMIPSLTEYFLRAGHPLAAIQVKVATPRQDTAHRPPTERRISTAAKNSLTAFAATLPADSALRASLERLADRSKDT